MLLILVETALVVWLLLHRATGRRAQRLLEGRLRFETLLAELSGKLIHVDAAGLDAALESAVGQLIAFLGIDRGNLDEYVEDASGLRVSCARPGIMELPSILAAEQFPWTADTLRAGGVVRFSSTAELPEQATTAPATTASGHARTCPFRCAPADRCSACCRSTRCGPSVAGPITSSSDSTS